MRFETFAAQLGGKPQKEAKLKYLGLSNRSKRAKPYQIAHSSHIAQIAPFAVCSSIGLFDNYRGYLKIVFADGRTARVSGWQGPSGETVPPANAGGSAAINEMQKPDR